MANKIKSTTTTKTKTKAKLVKAKLVKYSDHYTVLPNEIFTDLSASQITNAHRPFAYAYLYYITHLYRYCQHHIPEPQTQTFIKVALTRSKIDKTIDYIIKSDGLLDLMGYTQTTQNYPLSWVIDENDFLQFMNIQDSISTIPFVLSEKNFKIKMPIKSFYRSSDSISSLILDGTFYDVSNTHRINFSVFNLCMSSPDLGLNAFYIYGYIKYKNGSFPNGYDRSRRDFPTEMNVGERTLYKYIDALESYGLLQVKHQTFSGKGGMANSYKAL